MPAVPQACKAWLGFARGCLNAEAPNVFTCDVEMAAAAVFMKHCPSLHGNAQGRSRPLSQTAAHCARCVRCWTPVVHIIAGCCWFDGGCPPAAMLNVLTAMGVKAASDFMTHCPDLYGHEQATSRP